MKHTPILPLGVAVAPMGIAQLPQGQFALYALSEPQRAIRTLSRRQIGETIDLLIAALDTADGDCDLEDDDPAGWNVEDEPQDDEAEYGLTPDYGIDQRRCLPPMEVANSDRVVTRPHRDRIRRECCEKLRWADASGRTHLMLTDARRP